MVSQHTSPSHIWKISVGKESWQQKLPCFTRVHRTLSSKFRSLWCSFDQSFQFYHPNLGNIFTFKLILVFTVKFACQNDKLERLWCFYSPNNVQGSVRVRRVVVHRQDGDPNTASFGQFLLGRRRRLRDANLSIRHSNRLRRIPSRRLQRFLLFCPGMSGKKICQRGFL